MQSLRQYVVVVSLTAVVGLGAAGMGRPASTHRHGSLDDSIITRILEFFGIELQSRVSTPPG